MTDPIINVATDGHGKPHYMFFCPGCREPHSFNDAWSFNGDLIKPTVSPSLLVRGGHYAPGHDGECWCTFEARTGQKAKFHCQQCHSFVRDGKIEFLSDCTHVLAGQTVELPAWPPYEERYPDDE